VLKDSQLLFGDAVGLADKVGLSVGLLVEYPLGTADGDALGLPGVTVGVWVGYSLGFSVGNTVGL
jgi:hypothetical protein